MVGKPRGARRNGTQPRAESEARSNQLVVSAYRPPSEVECQLVRALVFNETPEQRICEIMGRPALELRAVFWRELNLSRDEIMATAAANVLWLANQRQDLGVALRANELVLKSRSKAWREPKAEEAQEAKRIGEMTLNEVEAEIARIEKRRRAAAAAPDESAHAPNGSRVVH